MFSQVGWLQSSTQTPSRPSSCSWDPSSSWASVTTSDCRFLCFPWCVCSNLAIHLQPLVKWAALRTSTTATWTPSPPTPPASSPSATSLGATPSTCSGTPSRGICRGRASSSDSPFRPSGTGAPIRSVRHKRGWCVLQKPGVTRPVCSSSAAGDRPALPVCQEPVPRQGRLHLMWLPKDSAHVPHGVPRHDQQDPLYWCVWIS